MTEAFLLTVVAGCKAVTVPHCLIAAVRQRPLHPGGRRSPLHALPSADTDDAAHQPALGFLLVHLVLLCQRVDEMVYGLALLQKHRVCSALGQRFNLIFRVELQQLLSNQGVHILLLIVPIIKPHRLMEGHMAGLCLTTRQKHIWWSFGSHI